MGEKEAKKRISTSPGSRERTCKSQQSNEPDASSPKAAPSTTRHLNHQSQVNYSLPCSYPRSDLAPEVKELMW